MADQQPARSPEKMLIRIIQGTILHPILLNRPHHMPELIIVTVNIALETGSILNIRKREAVVRAAIYPKRSDTARPHRPQKIKQNTNAKRTILHHTRTRL